MQKLFAAFFCLILISSAVEATTLIKVSNEQELATQTVKTQKLVLNQQATKKKILLAVPHTNSFQFWTQIEYFSRLVANSLDVELHVHQISRRDKNRYLYAESIEKVIKTQFVPDAIISVFWLHGETKLLDVSQRYRIPLITYNSQLSTKTISRIGRPRQKYRYWRAHLFPDDTAIGEQVAELLLKQTSRQMPVNMFALGGDTMSGPSLNRLKGLKITLKRYPNVKLINTVFTDWDSLVAKHKMLSLLRRFDPNDLQLVWTASDQLTLGVISAIEHLSYKPGKHIFVGGVDWTPESLNLIREDKQLFSIGGHFTEAGKGVLLAHEILHGFDFSDDLGTMQKTQMMMINKQNIDNIAPKLHGGYWKTLDFKTLSKRYNTNLEQYQLDIEHLLRFDTEQVNQ